MAVLAADVLDIAALRSREGRAHARLQRQIAGATLADAGAALGVTGRVVGMWEHHQRTPSVRHALEWARWLRTLEDA